MAVSRTELTLVVQGPPAVSSRVPPQTLVLLRSGVFGPLQDGDTLQKSASKLGAPDPAPCAVWAVLWRTAETLWKHSAFLDRNRNGRFDPLNSGDRNCLPVFITATSNEKHVENSMPAAQNWMDLFVLKTKINKSKFLPTDLWWHFTFFWPVFLLVVELEHLV